MKGLLKSVNFFWDALYNRVAIIDLRDFLQISVILNLTELEDISHFIWGRERGLLQNFIIADKSTNSILVLSKKIRVNNSLRLWSEDISLVEEWISLDSNSSRVKIHYSANEISSGSLDIHSKRSDHWRH